MSVAVLTRVFQESDATHDARLVLLVLADAAQDDGVCWPSQKVIAEKARVSENHVRACLRALETSKEIATRKAQRGRRRINVYRVMTAPGEPNYDELPFSLNEPFPTTGGFPRSSDGRGIDDRGNVDKSVADDRGNVDKNDADTVSLSLTVIEKRTVSNTLVAVPATSEPTAPPKLHKVDGQDLPFNALRAACDITPGDKNLEALVALALNGGRGGVKAGIREMAWGEVVAARYDGDYQAAHAEIAGERFEQGLVALIERRARQYIAAWPNIVITPTALAKWWLTAERMKPLAKPTGPTESEWAEMAEAERQGPEAFAALRAKYLARG